LGVLVSYPSNRSCHFLWAVNSAFNTISIATPAKLADESAEV
jgi:hypothetical protein